MKRTGSLSRLFPSAFCPCSRGPSHPLPPRVFRGMRRRTGRGHEDAPVFRRTDMRARQVPAGTCAFAHSPAGISIAFVLVLPYAGIWLEKLYQKTRQDARVPGKSRNALPRAKERNCMCGRAELFGRGGCERWRIGLGFMLPSPLQWVDGFYVCFFTSPRPCQGKDGMSSDEPCMPRAPARRGNELLCRSPCGGQTRTRDMFRAGESSCGPGRSLREGRRECTGGMFRLLEARPHEGARLAGASSRRRQCGAPFRIRAMHVSDQALQGHDPCTGAKPVGC